MRKLALLPGLMLLLAGCATSAKTFAPDGKAAYTINCSGSALNWGMCYQKAGDLCGVRGYTVLDKSGDTGAMAAGNAYSIFGTTVIDRSLLVECQ